MRYVFINPVTAQMYDSEALNVQLTRAGYTRVEGEVIWRIAVKARYLDLIYDTSCVWSDARCPMAVKLMHELGPAGIRVAPIEPILLCCAQELSARADLSDGDILITSPCSALADAGNALSLPRTRFITWREFALRERIDLTPRALNACPVPPGFFEGLPCKVASATGRTEISRFLSAEIAPDVRLIELLYCPDGCHNGDGVWPEQLHSDAKSTEER